MVMNCTNLKAAYLKSALRLLGYTYAAALAAPPIRVCLEARAKAAERRAQAAGEPKQMGLL